MMSWPPNDSRLLIRGSSSHNLRDRVQESFRRQGKLVRTCQIRKSWLLGSMAKFTRFKPYILLYRQVLAPPRVLLCSLGPMVALSTTRTSIISHYSGHLPEHHRQRSEQGNSTTDPTQLFRQGQRSAMKQTGACMISPKGAHVHICYKWPMHTSTASGQCKRRSSREQYRKLDDKNAYGAKPHTPPNAWQGIRYPTLAATESSLSGLLQRTDPRLDAASKALETYTCKTQNVFRKAAGDETPNEYILHCHWTRRSRDSSCLVRPSFPRFPYGSRIIPSSSVSSHSLWIVESCTVKLEGAVASKQCRKGLKEQAVSHSGLCQYAAAVRACALKALQRDTPRAICSTR